MNNTLKDSNVFGEVNIYHVYGLETTNKVLYDLQKRGFNYLFKLGKECISCEDYNIAFDEFEISEVHSLETEIATEYHVVYAIRCDKYNIKGIIINPFENYASNFLNTCLDKILNNEKLRFEYYDRAEPITRLNSYSKNFK